MRWEHVAALFILVAIALSCAKPETQQNTTGMPQNNTLGRPLQNTTILPVNRTVNVTAEINSAALNDYCASLGGKPGKECDFEGKSCDLWKLYVGECTPPFVEEKNRKAEAFIIDKIKAEPAHVRSIAIDKTTVHLLYTVQNTTMLITIEGGTIIQALRFGPLYPPMDYAKSDPNYEVGAPVRTPPPELRLIASPGATCGTSAHTVCRLGTCVWNDGDTGVCT